LSTWLREHTGSAREPLFEVWLTPSEV